MLCGVKAAIEENRGEHGLERIRQDRRAPEAATLEFALAEPEKERELELLGDIGKRCLLDEVCPDAREITLVERAVMMEEQRGDGDVQHRVAQKLKALVVTRAMASMRQRLLKQGRLVELVAERVLECSQ